MAKPTLPKAPPPKKPRQYYSARKGRNAPKLDLPMFKKLWYSLWEKYRDNEYFEEAFGKNCVDDPEPVGTVGKDIAAHLLRKMRKTNLWPRGRDGERAHRFVIGAVGCANVGISIERPWTTPRSRTIPAGDASTTRRGSVRAAVSPTEGS